MKQRQSRTWWTQTVARWRTSGLTAASFAEREHLSLSSLRGWASTLNRGTRAEHGTDSVVPIELELAPDTRSADPMKIEIVAGDAVLRIDVGTDLSYVAALLRALGAR